MLFRVDWEGISLFVRRLPSKSAVWERVWEEEEEEEEPRGECEFEFECECDG